MKKTLLQELLRMTIVSVALYALLFVVLWIVEQFVPTLAGHLLKWSDPAFVVGIPASILGTAYVLTIRNPENYTGFYLGLVMSVLLSIQFFLQESYDLVVLYLFVFIPFQYMALRAWSKTEPQTEESNEMLPRFLTAKHFFVVCGLSLLIVVLDVFLVGWLQSKGEWSEFFSNSKGLVITIMGAVTIASSFFANYLMIQKKNDAWVCWVFYSIASIVMFLLLANVFSIVLFCVMLFVNMSAQFAWLRFTDAKHFGWLASPHTVEAVRQHLSYKRGHIVDVVNRRIFDGEVQMRGGKIVAIRECQVPKNSLYILPGFVDSHIHIESTLLQPEEYAPMAVAQGTIGCIADPHEITNVLGEEAMSLMMNGGRKTRFHFYWGVPSCVPATPFETSGATITSADVRRLLQHPSVYGLGEMMNVPGVINRDPEVMAKIQAALDMGKRVDGHAPQLSGEALKQYASAGITDDHECTTLEEAREKLAAGMLVQIREGSAACDLDALMPILRESDDKVMFCSDDKYPDEISLGYINDMVVRCIRCGMPMWSVLNAACVTPVKHYGMKQGLLQPGDPADFICVYDLIDFDVRETYIDGRCVYGFNQPKKALRYEEQSTYTLDNVEQCPNHFLAEPIAVDQIRVKAEAGKQLKVIGTSEGSLLTRQLLVTPNIVDGFVESDVEQDVLKLVCLSRHSKSTPVTAFIHGFGLKRGAMASTIGHDSHNIIALGTNDEDIVRAINHLVKIKGGLVICEGPELIDMELPIAGLMSVRHGWQVGKRHAQLKAMAARMGCRYRAPFMTMAFMPLPVIPELKITDKGLFDATKMEFTGLFE